MANREKQNLRYVENYKKLNRKRYKGERGDEK